MALFRKAFEQKKNLGSKFQMVGYLYYPNIKTGSSPFSAVFIKNYNIFSLIDCFEKTKTFKSLP